MRVVRAVLILAVALAMLLALFWPPPAWGQTGAAPAGAAPSRPNGARLFESHCAGCHIHGGNIIRRGRTLKLAALRRNGIDGAGAIAAIAAGGIGQMGGYASVLGEDGTAAVGDWVWRQALEGWPRT